MFLRVYCRCLARRAVIRFQSLMRGCSPDSCDFFIKVCCNYGPESRDVFSRSVYAVMLAEFICNCMVPRAAICFSEIIALVRPGEPRFVFRNNCTCSA